MKIRPPLVQEVRIYFNQKGMPETEAQRFYDYYKNLHWKTTMGRPVEKWKQVAYRWIAAVVQLEPWLSCAAVH